MQIKFNAEKIIPDWKEYLKILISSLIVIYFTKGFLYSNFPSLTNISDFWTLVLLIVLITYLKDLFDFRIKGRRDYL